PPDAGEVAAALEGGGRHAVGELVVVDEVQTLVATPDLGVADLVLQGLELFEGAGARLFVHPVQAAKVLGKGVLDPLDEAAGDLLALLAEVLANEGAGEGEADGAVGGLQAAPKARRDLLLAGEDLLKLEVLADEGLGERGGGDAQKMPGEVGGEFVGPPAPQDFVHPSEEIGDGDVDGLDLGDSRLGEVDVPAEGGRSLLESLPVEAV